MRVDLRKIVEEYVRSPLGSRASYTQRNIKESDNNATTIVVSSDPNLPQREREKREENVAKKLTPEAFNCGGGV